MKRRSKLEKLLDAVISLNEILEDLQAHPLHWRADNVTEKIADRLREIDKMFALVDSDYVHSHSTQFLIATMCAIAPKLSVRLIPLLTRGN